MKNMGKDLNHDETADTIKMDKEEIISKINKKRVVYERNETFPWLTLCIILIYISVYFISIYGKGNILDVDFNTLNIFRVFNGQDILRGNFSGIITNVFIHRSIWDLVNTIFILLFCGFFIERYVKRSIILFVYILSILLFNIVSIFIYPDIYYLGSFTIVACMIGMCIYFCYRFKRFVPKIDMYIYIALTFIGVFISYMVGFYNIFQFIICYLMGIIVMFVLDTKVLRNNK